MKTVKLFFLLLSISLVGYSQVIDERIADAMNNGRWRELRQLYFAEGDSLETSFLHPLSRFYIYHFYNQPDSAIHYGSVILNEYQQELGHVVPSVMYFMADNYDRLGDSRASADILHQLNEAYSAGGLEPNPVFVSFENQYRALAEYGGFSVVKPKFDVRVPIRYHSGNRKDPVMIFVPAELNGVAYEVNYDTGAGVNVMSQEVADSIGAHIADVGGIEVKGVQKVASQFAIVDSIKLGGIIYRNVPFQIVDFMTGNKEADEKVRELNYLCVLGSQTMMPLGEIRFDFADTSLVIPAEQTPKPDFAPNLYRSDNNMFILSVFDRKSEQVIDANLDTGASLSVLHEKYYKHNESLFEGAVPNDSLRWAGVGGVHIVQTFTTPWDYKVGHTKASMDSISVIVSNDEQEEYDCWFGLPSMTQHDLMTINFKDMWVDFCSK